GAVVGGGRGGQRRGHGRDHGLFLLAGGKHRQGKAGGQHESGDGLHFCVPRCSVMGGCDQSSSRRHSVCSASATAAGTNPEMSPPRREISRTSEEEMKPYCSAGVRNSVSTSGIRWRFMLASWNSYSKSDTARRPRSSTPPPTSATKWASSELKPMTSTLAWEASAPRASSTRRSSDSAGPLAGLSATPTISLSNSGAARSTRSTWPLVIGSNVPG